MHFFLYILSLCAVDVAAITLSRQWEISKQWYWLVASMVFFCLMPIIFARATMYASSGITNAIWVASSSILITISGYYIFKEHLSTQQIIGLGVIIIGLVIVEIK
jgi:multidrug transporter EmrE-like cation transporter